MYCLVSKNKIKYILFCNDLNLSANAITTRNIKKKVLPM